MHLEGTGIIISLSLPLTQELVHSNSIQFKVTSDGIETEVVREG